MVLAVSTSHVSPFLLPCTIGVASNNFSQWQIDFSRFLMQHMVGLSKLYGELQAELGDSNWYYYTFMSLYNNNIIEI